MKHLNHTLRFIRLWATPLAICYSMLGCKVKPQAYNNALDFALASTNPKIKRVMAHLNSHEVQILYTHISKDTTGIPKFQSYTFQVNENQYFYPASTVKFPAAVLSLEKLEQLGYSHKAYFTLGGDSIPRQFSRTVDEIFAVSDNEANNRLFEFLGPDYFNKTLREKGITPIRISHRLSTEHAANPQTQAIKITQAQKEDYHIGPKNNAQVAPLQLKGLKKGKGYMDKGVLVKKPFNFALKNYFSIKAQHEMMKRVIFPEAFPKQAILNLGKQKRRFLLKSMHTLPKNQGYNAQTYYDSYGKFLLFGDTKDPIPNHIKIYNKVGYAYGTLTDCAFIHDTKNDISFIITATILVNKNSIFNDNQYEYDTVGIPFLAQLGREIYAYERYLKNGK